VNTEEHVGDEQWGVCERCGCEVLGRITDRYSDLKLFEQCWELAEQARADSRY